VCNQSVSFLQWDGASLVTLLESYRATDLIAGTELIPGPQ
jgi:hypothetical protein